MGEEASRPHPSPAELELDYLGRMHSTVLELGKQSSGLSLVLLLGCVLSLYLAFSGLESDTAVLVVGVSMRPSILLALSPAVIAIVFFLLCVNGRLENIAVGEIWRSYSRLGLPKELLTESRRRFLCLPSHVSLFPGLAARTLGLRLVASIVFLFTAVAFFLVPSATYVIVALVVLRLSARPWLLSSVYFCLFLLFPFGAFLGFAQSIENSVKTGDGTS